jgi:septal ring factor EnvC (AmiA/AmiB activator)
MARHTHIHLYLAFFTAALVLLTGCSNPYYSAMETVGVHKRDIMVDRVENARDAQQDAQEQFKSALEQFNSVVSLEETDLKKAYEQLNDEYEECVAIADKVSDRIDKVKAVSEALFDEWADEIKLYENKELARASKEQLNNTKARYEEMLSHMQEAEKSMEPVLRIFRDNVLFLKHNLNAQAIGSLQDEFAGLELEIDKLIGRMNEAIESSNAFIADMQTN